MAFRRILNKLKTGKILLILMKMPMNAKPRIFCYYIHNEC